MFFFKWKSKDVVKLVAREVFDRGDQNITILGCQYIKCGKTNGNIKFSEESQHSPEMRGSEKKSI